MKRVNLGISLINIIIITAFWYRYSSPILSSVIGFSHSDFLSAQANHNALLQIHLGIFTILLAILGVFGYNEIKKSADRIAEKRAERALNELVPKLVKEQIEKIGPEELAQMLVNLKMSTPLKKDENDLSDEIRVEKVFDSLE